MCFRFQQFYLKSFDGLTYCFNISQKKIKKMINFQIVFAKLTFCLQRNVAASSAYVSGVWFFPAEIYEKYFFVSFCHFGVLFMIFLL